MEKEIKIEGSTFTVDLPESAKIISANLDNGLGGIKDVTKQLKDMLERRYKNRCLVFEFGRPAIKKPFKFNSSLTYRFGWLWFAISFIKMDLQDYSRACASGQYGWVTNDINKAKKDKFYTYRKMK